MSFIKSITNSWFEKHSDDKYLYYPFGNWSKTGYLISTSQKKAFLRQIILWSWLPTIVFSIAYLSAAVKFLPWNLDYIFFSHCSYLLLLLVVHIYILNHSAERISVRRSYLELGQKYSLTWLYIGLVSSIVLVSLGVHNLATTPFECLPSRKSFNSVFVTLLFGKCIFDYFQMIRALHKAKN